MRRLVIACGASLAIYIVAFGFVLDRPLTLGMLRTRIETNIAFGASITQPKLVLLAGSNGPYSHRCETIAIILRRPCVNAGVAVGVGLDYLYARWKPLLHPGDIVYLPLEEAQYVRARLTTDLGPDATIMLRHDRATLSTLPLHRQIASVFATDLRAAVMSVIETALPDDGLLNMRAAVTGTYSACGDHIGHTTELALVSKPALAAAHPLHPTSQQITDGYGTVLVTDFLEWARAHGVRVIGGLPTGFDDSPIRDDSLRAIRAIYHSRGADFLELPNHSRYPRAAFFDTPDHLNETAQVAHSIAVAEAMLRLIARVADRVTR